MDHIGPEPFEDVRRALRDDPRAHLDALEHELASASDELIAAVHPYNLLDAIAPHASRRTKEVAICLVHLYTQTLERVRARTPSEDRDRAMKNLEGTLVYIGYRARGPVLCEGEPCLDGEICIQPLCCAGPCDPPAPYCYELPAGLPAAEACSVIVEPACPRCTVHGDEAICECSR